jgi:hypothetical protein
MVFDVWRCKMKDFAWLTNGPVPDSAAKMAQAKGITIKAIGYFHPYETNPSDIADKGGFDGVIVDHAAQAMTLCNVYKVGVLEYGMNETGLWSAVNLHIYDNRKFHSETLPHVVFWAGTGRVEFSISDGRSGSSPIIGKETQGIVIGRILQSLGLHPNEFTYEVLGVTNV